MPMKRWLQELSFKKSFYERPNQKWLCGRACQGQGCLTGPDASGRCTATTECRPLRKGDRWHCTRPAFMGGPCADGPAPDGSCRCVVPKCNPVRSLRSWRGLTILGVAGAALAALLYMLGASNGAKYLSPGKLSFAHASVGSKCSDCHDTAGTRPVSWLEDTTANVSMRANSHLCLACHNVGSTPFQPHSQPAAQLALQTAAVQAGLKVGGDTAPLGLRVASLIAGPAHPAGTELACATCHREHQGTQADLRQLSNEQCQSCHARQFTSLADGHPQFATYPFERRTRLIFDHQKHIQEHFMDAAFASLAPRTCVDCHQTDLNGNTMRLKSFATICAACHGPQIKGKGRESAGLAFISLPHFDEQALTGKYAIGEWPDDTSEEKLNPFTRLLLAADPALRPALAELAGASLASLPKHDTNKLAAAQQLAWGIKGLIYDLGRLGQNELSGRVELALGHPLTDAQREGVVAGLNAEVLRNTFSSSFPHLQAEMLDYRKHHQVAQSDWVASPGLPTVGPDKTMGPDSWVSHGGWYTMDGAFALFYRAQGHTDRFLSSWLELTAATEQSPDPTAATAVFNQLSAPKAVGYCAKCHSVDDQPTRTINWVGSQPDANRHKYTHFSHRAHLSLIDNQGCFTCHPLKSGDAKPAYADAFAPGQHDPAKYASNFEAIDKATCANCHQPGRVRDDCLVCHNYHVGTFQAVMPNVNMHRQPESPQPSFSPIPGAH